MRKSEEELTQIREELIREIQFAGELEEDEIREYIDQRLLELGMSCRLCIADKNQLAEEVFNHLRRLGILQELVDDPAVTEIMINGPSEIFIEKEGQMSRWSKKFSSREELENIIQRIVAKTNRRVNEAEPIVDSRLENGARINIVLPPVALNGPIVTIRRFPENPYSMQDLVHMGALSQELAWFLRELVTSGYNIFISGGTGSGKTTFLNALAGFIPREERIVVVEDCAELNIRSVPNQVRLETRNANYEGENEITIRQLIRTALRMRPDRIIVGEIRGGEALDMLQAMNTGHDGSISTGHANSCRDMIRRMETMVLMGAEELPLSAVRGQIASGVDILVHLKRFRDHTRKVYAVEEIRDIENGEISLHCLYRFDEEEGEEERVRGSWVKKGELINQEKLRRRKSMDRNC